MPTVTPVATPDHPTITVPLAPGVELRLDALRARDLQARLAAALGPTPASGAALALTLPDDHPSWENHSGGPGHDEPEWTRDDLALAEDFYASLSNKAKLLFDTLLDHTGRQLSVDDLVEITGGVLKNDHSVAGAINGMHQPRVAAGRRYPFRWWRGTPSRFGVRPSTGSLFLAARAAVEGRRGH